MNIDNEILQGRYSDFTLIINEERMLAHKLVLFASPHFREMFNDFNDNNDIAKFMVEKPDIMKDVILSLYGRRPVKEDWEYCLYYAKYQDMLLLPLSDAINKLKVPAKGYGLLLDTLLPMLSKKNKLIGVLRRNLPDGYDLSHLSESLIKEIQQHDEYKTMEYYDPSGKRIEIHDSTDTVVFTTHISRYAYMYGPTNYGLLMIVDHRRVEIVNIRNNKNMLFNDASCYFVGNNGFATLLDGIITLYNNEFANIYSQDIIYHNNINDYIMLILETGNIELYHTINNQIITINTNTLYEKLMFTCDMKYVIAKNATNADVYNLEGELLLNSNLTKGKYYEYDSDTNKLTIL